MNIETIELGASVDQIMESRRCPPDAFVGANGIGHDPIVGRRQSLQPHPRQRTIDHRESDFLKSAGSGRFKMALVDETLAPLCHSLLLLTIRRPVAHRRARHLGGLHERLDERSPRRLDVPVDRGVAFAEVDRDEGGASRPLLADREAVAELPELGRESLLPRQTGPDKPDTDEEDDYAREHEDDRSNSGSDNRADGTGDAASSFRDANLQAVPEDHAGQDSAGPDSPSPCGTRAGLRLFHLLRAVRPERFT
jgi:hypothetical protein